MVESLNVVVPWGCLQFVVVVFPDHTLYFYGGFLLGGGGGGGGGWGGGATEMICVSTIATSSKTGQYFEQWN